MMEYEKSIDDINLEIKKYELKKIIKESTQGTKLAPTLVTVIVALISLFGSFIASYIQKNNQLDLERSKFESDLIVMAVKSTDLKSRRDNLRFLLEIGLIKNNSVELSRVLKDTTLPILNFPSYTRLNPIYSLNGVIIPPKEIQTEDIKINIWPHSSNNETSNLQKTIEVNREGRFMIKNLEEINYVMQFMYDTIAMKVLMYSPNMENPDDTKLFDLSQVKIHNYIRNKVSDNNH